MKSVLIVYHFIAHYRIPIFNLLSKKDIPSYSVLAGVTADIQIKKADLSLSEKSPEKGGIKWIKIRNYWFFKHCLFQPAVLKHSVSRKYSTIIYLGTMYFISTWIGAILAKLTGKKVIFWSHGFIKKENNLKGFVRLMFYKLADEILVYGNHSRSILIEKGFNPEKVKIIYNSLDYFTQKKVMLKSINSAPESIFKRNNFPIVGFIGRLTPQKKVDLLMDVVYEINCSERKVNLVIIGDGPQTDMLKSRANSLCLDDNVKFYGQCYDEEQIYSLMRQISVIVSPGEVGLTAIHALSYGVPVITHNNPFEQMPEFESIIPDETGDFYDQKNSKTSLKELIVKWAYEKNKKASEEKCYEIIDKLYNPMTQAKIFDSLVS